MSLYLCVFDGPRELAGADLGAYADFGAFRRAVADRFGTDEAGARFPTLLGHSDCDGEWTPAECVRLAGELAGLAAARPPLSPFTDVDGEDLIARLRELAEVARRHDRPILFQ